MSAANEEPVRIISAAAACAPTRTYSGFNRASVGNIAEAAVVGSAFVGAISSAQDNDYESAAETFISILVNGG